MSKTPQFTNKRRRSKSRDHSFSNRRSSSSEYRSPSPRPFLLLLTDACLFITLFAVPFLMGGRIPLARLVLAISVSAGAVSYALHQLRQKQARLKWTFAEPLLLAGALLGVLQLLPLSANLITHFSPRLYAILPLWSPAGDGNLVLGLWNRLSLAPEETRAGLAVFCSYALLFAVTVQRVQGLHDAERILRMVGCVVLAMAGFGLLQYVTSNGKFFWFYDHPQTNTFHITKGSFTNRNHFAQFLALGIGPLIWWLVHSMDRRQREKGSQHAFGSQTGKPLLAELSVPLLAIGLGLVLFSGMLSLSRGGIVAMGLAVVVAVGLMFRQGRISGKLFASLAGIFALLAALLGVFGHEMVSRRLDNWESPDRLKIWKANVAVFRDFTWVGTGIGTHVEAYKLYLDEPVPANKEFSHAENGYLQIASETGVAGLSLVGLGMLLCTFWCLRGIRLDRAGRIGLALAAISASLVANFAHSMGDFIWYAPGCMVVLVVLAALAARLYQLAQYRRKRSWGDASNGDATAGIYLPRLGWIGCLIGCVGLGWWTVQPTLPAVAAFRPWDEYRRLNLRKDAFEQSEAESDNSAAALAQREEYQRFRLQQKLNALMTAARRDPYNARIQIRASMAYLTLFHILQNDGDNPMTLAQIREAAQLSQFESIEAMNEWLKRAVGENRKYLDHALAHCRRALQLCPLQGEGYLYLAELGFLEELSPESENVYLEQALTVRPYDSQVLFAAGREAWTDENIEQALAYWRESFHRDVTYQQRIIDLLSPAVPASFFIERFDPDWPAVVRLRDAYRKLDRPDDYQQVLSLFAKLAADEGQKDLQHKDYAASIEHLMQSHNAYLELNNGPGALATLKQALKVDSNSFRVRFKLALWLYKQQQYDNALKQIDWCLKREPDNYDLKVMAERATDAKLRGETLLRVANPPSAMGISSLPGGMNR